MSITIHIHQAHRIHTNGFGAVLAEGRTVGECLEDLVRRYPGMRNELYDPATPGRLRNIIEIHLNNKKLFPDVSAKYVAEGDVIHIALMLSGG